VFRGFRIFEFVEVEVHSTKTNNGFFDTEDELIFEERSRLPEKRKVQPRRDRQPCASEIYLHYTIRNLNSFPFPV
jgi:hypothetical protein